MKKGFTLLELLVVIAIIGILSSVVLASVNSARDGAEIAAGLQFENQVHKKLYNCLVAQYDFEDVDNLGKDSSGYGRDAVNTGAVAAEGVNDSGGLLLNGTNNYVRIPNDDGVSQMDNLTITSWVKWDGSGGDNMIVNKEGSAYEYRVNDGNVSLATNAWAWRGGQSSKVVADNWAHIAITHEYPGRQKIYINGKETFSNSTQGVINKSLNNVTIGARYDGTSSFFGGVLDNIRIYNCSL